MIQVGDRVAYTGDTYLTVPTGTLGTVTYAAKRKYGMAKDRMIYHVRWDTRKGLYLFSHTEDELQPAPKYREDV